MHGDYMVKAYILIRTQIGMVDEVRDKLKRIPGIVSVDEVSGPIDIIAIAEADSLRNLRNLILGEIHAIEGVTRTETALVL